MRPKEYKHRLPLDSCLLKRLVDPCLTTTLTLPTVFPAVEIGSMSGIGSTQLFAPATDTAATSAGIAGLCGPRVYSIVEASVLAFTTIDAFAGTDEYVDNWSLTFLSNSVQDMGTWTVTLEVTL